jgi:hypothetical protein
VQGGLNDKALSALRDPVNKIDVNELDQSSGMTLAHLTCALGAMVRLLTKFSKKARFVVLKYLFSFVIVGSTSGVNVSGRRYFHVF